MKKVVITGAKGNIGKILTKGLKNYELILLDLPKTDLRKYKQLEKNIENCDMIIHLAWNTKKENHLSKKSYAPNLFMVKNILKIASEKKIPRVILASSIHADDFRNPKRKFLSPDDVPKPKSPYGKSKVKIEKMGKSYSRKGLEIVCVRFGAIGYGEPPKDEEGKKVWLSKKDCIDLIKTIIEAKKIPRNFFTVYGVSNNKNRVHNYKNPLNWEPKEGVK